ncbi:MAG: flagellar basal body P-ring protein FlgI [Candidatus Latescibacterota bacterium]|nr:flagellar basal body P-ring protein FlgI [Candidatus Latescibacterota bacterium]
MKTTILTSIFALAAASVLLEKGIEAQFMPDFEPQSVRLKDIGEIQTVQDIQLIGYGLITGLEGNGDGRGAPFTVQSLANLMRNMGVEVDPQTIRAKNAASVMVTARLSPTSRVGSSIDVTVSSLGDAASLQGGILLMTGLQADPPNSPIVAIAQGAVSIGGFNAEGGGGGSITKNHPVVGRIPNGAIVQQELAPAGNLSPSLTVTIRDPDYTTAARLAHSIDTRFGRPIAFALDAGTINVNVPRDNQTPSEFIEFIAKLEAVRVIPDLNARVVVNERTGTIVAGESVMIAEVAIAHGGLSISIGPDITAEGGAPGGAQAQLQLGGAVTVDEEKPRVLALPPASNVSDVAKALNALKVTPRDIIAIFQALKRAGALKSELIII